MVRSKTYFLILGILILCAVLIFEIFFIFSNSQNNTTTGNQNQNIASTQAGNTERRLTLITRNALSAILDLEYKGEVTTIRPGGTLLNQTYKKAIFLKTSNNNTIFFYIFDNIPDMVLLNNSGKPIDLEQIKEGDSLEITQRLNLKNQPEDQVIRMQIVKTN